MWHFDFKIKAYGANTTNSPFVTFYIESYYDESTVVPGPTALAALLLGMPGTKRSRRRSVR